jgi:hypothetical protein
MNVSSRIHSKISLAENADSPGDLRAGASLPTVIWYCLQWHGVACRGWQNGGKIFAGYAPRSVPICL